MSNAATRQVGRRVDRKVQIAHPVAMNVAYSTATILLAAPLARTLVDRLGLDNQFEDIPTDALNAGEMTRITLYFDARPQRSVVQALNRHAGACGASGHFQLEELPATDWIAKSLQGLAPVRAGRFVVHGRHDRSAARANDIAVEVEAGQAFGTGHHGTTVGCLRAIDATLKAGTIRNAADIGSGTGVLAIAIAKLAHVPVLASDIDPVAITVAQDNIRLNGVHAFVDSAVATGTRHGLFRRAGPFDLIVANILATPLAAMAHDIARIAAPGAIVILSGLLPHQRRRIVASYRNAGFRHLDGNTVDGWLTLRVQRPATRR